MILNLVYHDLGVLNGPHHCISSPNPLPLKRIELGSSAPPRILGLLGRKDNPKAQLTDAFFDQLVKLVENENPTALIH